MRRESKELRREISGITRSQLEGIAASFALAPSTVLQPWSTAAVDFDHSTQTWSAACGWHPEFYSAREETATTRSVREAFEEPRGFSPHRERARLSLSNARYSNVLRGATPAGAPLPPERFHIVDAKTGAALSGTACVTVVDALGVSKQLQVATPYLRWRSLPLGQMADGPCVVHFTAAGYDATSRVVLKAGSRHAGTLRKKAHDLLTPRAEREGPSETIAINSTLLDEGQCRVVLRWSGAHNADLDLHCVADDEVHCFFGNPQPRADVSLDVDAREGTAGGPETLTIACEPGVSYTLFVHNHDLARNGRTAVNDLSASGASLTVHRHGKAPRTIGVPAHSQHRCVWEALTLRMDDDNRIHLTAANRVRRSVRLPGGGVLSGKV